MYSSGFLENPTKRLLTAYIKEIMTGSISPAGILFPCQINGNIPGSPPGIWHFMQQHLFISILILPSSNCSVVLREYYMHPNGQIPAYEWNFSDVNPPVHAWGVWYVFEEDKKKTGVADWDFLERAFQKLLMNFTWWVNQKDANGTDIFEGGFLGLDNIGVFDRNHMPPGIKKLQQADATSWMAMYSINMLRISLGISPA